MPARLARTGDLWGDAIATRPTARALARAMAALQDASAAPPPRRGGSGRRRAGGTHAGPASRTPTHGAHDGQRATRSTGGRCRAAGTWRWSWTRRSAMRRRRARAATAPRTGRHGAARGSGTPIRPSRSGGGGARGGRPGRADVRSCFDSRGTTPRWRGVCCGCRHATARRLRRDRSAAGGAEGSGISICRSSLGARCSAGALPRRARRAGRRAGGGSDGRNGASGRERGGFPGRRARWRSPPRARGAGSARASGCRRRRRISVPFRASSAAHRLSR